jgi:hypothetical protein
VSWTLAPIGIANSWSWTDSAKRVRISIRRSLGCQPPKSAVRMFS